MTVSISKLLSPASVFDHKTLSYIYDNGWEFTNFFDGLTRLTTVNGKELKERVEISEPAVGIYFVTWEDAEMGLLCQVINLKERCLEVAVLMDGKPQIWKAEITHFE